MALVGATIVRGEPHRKVREWLDIDPPRHAFLRDELYADAVPCLRRLKEGGYLVGAVGNMAIDHEPLVEPYVDFVSSSERWGIEKPAPEFFERLLAEADRQAHEVAYVGDHVVNDVEPALAAGMVSVHVRRGPWGYLLEPPPEAIRIRSLEELPEVLP
jgi:HAD superfamily hydrolase (TIGR01549 family)